MSNKILTFKEFTDSRKMINQQIDKNKLSHQQKNVKQLNWEVRKSNWIQSVNKLYNTVDNIIVKNYIESGFDVINKKEPVRLYEDYIGAYEIDNYFINIEIDNMTIKFFPIGTIVIGAYGRVNMLLGSETIKLVMPEWDQWKIITGIGSSMKLIDFNEKNIIKLFQEYL